MRRGDVSGVGGGGSDFFDESGVAVRAAKGILGGPDPNPDETVASITPERGGSD